MNQMQPLADRLRYWIRELFEEAFPIRPECIARVKASEKIAFVWAKRSTSLQLIRTGKHGGLLTSLPDLSEFTFLEQFDASHHLLDCVPDWMQEWKKLEKLNFSNNLLAELPEWIQSFQHMRVLNLRDNFLGYEDLLPLAQMCSSQCEVYVGGNQLDLTDVIALNRNGQNVRFVF